MKMALDNLTPGNMAPGNLTPGNLTSRFFFVLVKYLYIFHKLLH